MLTGLFHPPLIFPRDGAALGGFDLGTRRTATPFWVRGRSCIVARVFSGDARLMELFLEKHGALMTRRPIVVG